MGIFRRQPTEAIVELHEVDVVGESHYQDALLAICGGKKHRGGSDLDCAAELRHEPDNPYDPNAVGVWIDGRKVGHLSRDVAAIVCTRLSNRSEPCIVSAHIVGGWDRGDGDEGSFGVRLLMPHPTRL